MDSEKEFRASFFRNLDRVPRHLFGGPVVFLFTLAAILLLGSFVCEFYMAKYGRATRLYYPYMTATTVAGFTVLGYFLLRCINFNYLTDGEDGEQPMIRKFWFFSFLTSVIVLISIFGLIWEFECAYIPHEAGLFKWNPGMIDDLLHEHWIMKWNIIIGTIVTTVLSWFASIEDDHIIALSYKGQ